MNKEEKELTENEMLKAICDKIGCRYEQSEYLGDGQSRLLDVREIIFTQEFIDTYWDYLAKQKKLKTDKYLQDFRHHLITNLNNPTLYLYNLLKDDR